MIIDVICLLLVLLFGFLGYRSGLLKQLARMAAVVAGFFVARMLMGVLGPLFSRMIGAGDFVGEVVAFLAVFFLVALAVGLFGGAIARKASEAGEAFTFFNRGIGGLLGGLKGMVLVYVVLAALSALGPFLRPSAPKLYEQLGYSVVGREVIRHNLLQREVFPRAKAIVSIVNLIQNPTARDSAMRDPNLYIVLSHPDAAFLRDPAIQQAILEGRWEELVRDGRVFGLLRDREVVDALNRIHDGLSVGGPDPSSGGGP